MAIKTGDVSSAYIEGARVYHNANQTIASGTWTTLSFNSERYDTDNIHDPTTNNSRLTCRAAGKYLIIAHGYFASNATGIRAMRLLLNGLELIGYFQAHVGADGYWRGIVSTTYNLAVDDYVEVQVNQTSGAELDFLCFGQYSPEFMMQRIG